MAFIFVPLLAMTGIAAFCLWIYFSHCIVVVVEDTAAGNDEIIWPGDPLLDWIWQGAYILWIVGVWVAPAVLVSRMATRHLDVEWHIAGDPITAPQVRGIVTVLVALSVFWLFFPVSLLSTMSAESRWAILHGGLFARLARNMASLLLFYLISGVMVAVCAPLLIWLALGSDVVSLIVGGLALAGTLLLIARLLGRLANRARLTHVGSAKKSYKRKPSRRMQRNVTVTDPWELPEDGPELPEPPPPRFVQPSELPGLQTPMEGELVGYDVNFDHSPTAPAEAKSTAKLEAAAPWHSRDADNAETRAADRQTRKQRAQLIKPDRLEMQRAKQREEQTRSTLLTHGLATFLFQKMVVVEWVILSLGTSFLGLLIRGLRATFPE